MNKLKVENFPQKNPKNTHTNNLKRVTEKFFKKLLLITHKRPHLDELLAILIYILLKLSTEEDSINAFLKVVENLEFMFVNSGERFNAPQNGVAFGTGKGSYDEHKSFFNGQYFDSDRIPGQCSATLVAEYAEKNKGVTIVERLKELLDYVLIHDSKGYRNSMDIADLFNCLKRKEEDKDLMRLGIKILYSFYKVNSLPTQEERDKLAKLIEDWLKNKNLVIAEPIIKYAKGLRHGNRVSFDLTQILHTMKNTYNEKCTINVVKKLLEAKYWSQKNFFDAIEELKKKGKVDWIPRENTVLKMITIESGNFQAPKAARNRKHGPGAAWLNMKTLDKKFLALHDKKFNLSHEIRNIVATFRLEEQLIRGIKNPLIDFRQLGRPGSLNIPGVGDIWYFQKEDRGGKIFNGTESRDVEETKIPLNEIRRIIRTVLMLGRNFRWNVWVVKRLKYNLT